MSENTCPICGKPTYKLFGNERKDHLCAEHGKLANDGKIVQCSDCGAWHNVNEECACKKSVQKNKYSDVLTCIICGQPSNGKHFCLKCYHNYKNKEILIKVKNCSQFDLLDVDYEGRLACKDGHVVKSKSEREIDNYLFEHDIRHAYERELPYGAEENEVLHPDFFLPNYLGENNHVYIEHWGYNEDNIQYAKAKKFKMSIYEKLGITLICTYEKSDSKNIDTVLDRKLNKENIKPGKINFKEK